MRQRMIGICLAVLLGLCFAASVPQAQATAQEKYPTSTSVITAGWNNPTNAYTNDASYANTSTSNAIQEYSGFGFNFNETDTIDKVLVWVEFIGDLYVPAADLLADLTANLRVYDGSTWSMKSYLYFIGWTNGLDDCYVTDSLAIGRAIDYSSHVSTPTEVNNMKIRIQQVWSGGSGTFTLQIDYISILVSYTAPTDEYFVTGLFFGSVIFGCIGLIGAVSIKRRE